MVKDREKNKIISLIEDLREISKKHYPSSCFYMDMFDNLKNQIETSDFKITIVGEFSSGKSTFLNALIGKDILLHSVNETTAALTYIRNVGKEDSRIDKIYVYLRGVEEPIIKELDEGKNFLKEFTTTKSESYDVINTIERVEIFKNFLQNDDSVVLVDTPGLNGTADGHREVTLSEIRSAHVSIFLVPIRGISYSSLELIKAVQDNQKKMIFVINQIDELREEEGETLEKHIEIMDLNLSNIISKENYVIFGISALKALVSKDYSIKRLYKNDSSFLTNEDREKLAVESKFKFVENYIFEELLKDIKKELNDLLKHRGNEIFLEWIKSLENDTIFLQEKEIVQEENSIQNKILSIHKAFERKKKKIDELLKIRLNTLEKEKENLIYLKRLEKITESRNYLNEILKNNNNLDLIERILLDFIEREAEVYFKDRVLPVKTQLFNGIKKELERIYYEGILEIKDISDKFQTLDIKDEFQIDLTREEKENLEFEKLKNLEKEIKKELLHINQDLNFKSRDILKVENTLKDLQEKIRYTEKKIADKQNQLDIGLKKLGTKPEPQIKIRKTEKFEEKGFFGSLFSGEKYKKVIYEDEYFDYSAQENFYKEMEVIKKSYRFDSFFLEKNNLMKDISRTKKTLEKIKLDIRELKYKKDILEIDKNRVSSQHKREKIKILKESIKISFEKNINNFFEFIRRESQKNIEKGSIVLNSLLDNHYRKIYNGIEKSLSNQNNRKEELEETKKTINEIQKIREEFLNEFNA